MQAEHMEWELDSMKNRQVDEFIFLNEEDAQLARNEKHPYALSL